MTPRRRVASRPRTLTGLIAASALVLAACGETIDLRDQEDAADTSAATAPPAAAEADAVSLGPDSTLDELLPLMLERWRGLDQRVIDNDAVEPLARIEEVWVLAEPIIRADHQGALFGFQQAVDLARSAVQRNRPADASKGYRLAIELTGDLLQR